MITFLVLPESAEVIDDIADDAESVTEDAVAAADDVEDSTIYYCMSILY